MKGVDDHGYVARTAEVIATKWTPQLLEALSRGPAGFCDLQRAIPGIAPRTLTLRLRSLEAAGIVQRGTPAVRPAAGAAPSTGRQVVDCDDPAADERNGAASRYALTTMGEALLPIVAAMRRFGREWQCAKPLRVVA